MKAGDRIYWMNASSPAAHDASVPGIFIKEGPKRVLIEVPYCEPYTKHWSRIQKWVDPARISPRILPCEALTEPLELVVHGFSVGYYRHPNPGAKAFPHGVFYGTVDGYTTTAPCSSAESAVAQAHHALLSGAYEVSLRSHRACYQSWLAQGVEGGYLIKAENGILDVRERMKQLATAGLLRRA